MSTLILDSSILLASVLPDEPLTQQAIDLLIWADTQATLVAPRLFRSELVAVIRKAVFQKRISHEEGKEFLITLLAYPVEFFDDDLLLVEAYEIAARLGLARAYDAQYLVLAERHSCDFWTADERLYNSIQSRFDHIHWLGDFSL